MIRRWGTAALYVLASVLAGWAVTDVAGSTGLKVYGAILAASLGGLRPLRDTFLGGIATFPPSQWFTEGGAVDE